MYLYCETLCTSWILHSVYIYFYVLCASLVIIKNWGVAHVWTNIWYIFHVIDLNNLSVFQEKLTYFRIKELKDVLTQLGLSKQGKKQVRCQGYCLFCSRNKKSERKKQKTEKKKDGVVLLLRNYFTFRFYGHISYMDFHSVLPFYFNDRLMCQATSLSTLVENLDFILISWYLFLFYLDRKLSILAWVLWHARQNKVLMVFMHCFHAGPCWSDTGYSIWWAR